MLMGCWEILTPRRQSQTKKSTRWIMNLSMSFMNTIVLRALFVSGALGVALIAENEGWGLLNLMMWPAWGEILAAIILLDFVIYGQHVLFHAFPFLWNLHKVHHSDVDIDVSTAVRFHPGEMVISMLIKIGAIMIIGASPAAVLIFEVLLNATAMFNHGNVRIPEQVDRMLRWIVVTPDMHRVHHSVISQECHRNFGFNLPWWDRMLGTYLHEPSQGHEQMTIGLGQYRDPTQLTLLNLLALPFVGEYENRPVWHHARKDVVVGNKK